MRPNEILAQVSRLQGSFGSFPPPGSAFASSGPKAFALAGLPIVSDVLLSVTAFNFSAKGTFTQYFRTKSGMRDFGGNGKHKKIFEDYFEIHRAHRYAPAKIGAQAIKDLSESFASVAKAKTPLGELYSSDVSAILIAIATAVCSLPGGYSFEKFKQESIDVLVQHSGKPGSDEHMLLTSLIRIHLGVHKSSLDVALRVARSTSFAAAFSPNRQKAKPREIKASVDFQSKAASGISQVALRIYEEQGGNPEEFYTCLDIVSAAQGKKQAAPRVDWLRLWWRVYLEIGCGVWRLWILACEKAIEGELDLDAESAGRVASGAFCTFKKAEEDCMLDYMVEMVETGEKITAQGLANACIGADFHERTALQAKNWKHHNVCFVVRKLKRRGISGSSIYTPQTLAIWDHPDDMTEEELKAQEELCGPSSDEEDKQPPKKKVKTASGGTDASVGSTKTNGKSSRSVGASSSGGTASGSGVTQAEKARLKQGSLLGFGFTGPTV